MVTSPAGREPLSIRNGKTAISPTYGASVLFFCQGGRGQRIETAGRLDAGGSGHRTNAGHIGTNVKEWHVRHRRRRSVTDVDECWTHRHRKKDVQRLHILFTSYESDSIPCNWRPAPKSRILCLSRRGRHDNRVPSRQKSSQCYTKASRAARFRTHCPWFDRADFQGRETAIINGGRGQQGTACRETTLAILKRLARAVGVPVTELLDGRLEGLST
jgi:hypothetical protein